MALAGLFLIFAIVILAVSPFIRKPDVISDIRLAYGQEFLIIGAVILPLLLGKYFLMLFLLLLNIRGHLEFAGVQEKSPFNPGMVASLSASSLIIAGISMFDANAIPGFLPVSICLSYLVIILALLVAGRRDDVFLGCMVIIVLLACVSLVNIYRMEHGLFIVLYIYAVTETNDTGGYVFGKIFGRRKLFPVLSPGKTAEGMLCGIFFSLVTGLLYNHLFLGESTARAIIITLVLIASAISGDLIFSFYKRRYNRKDYTSVLAKQGGVMDIYDSFLLASIAYYLVQVTGM